jgi:hypothetical protein
MARMMTGGKCPIKFPYCEHLPPHEEVIGDKVRLANCVAHECVPVEPERRERGLREKYEPRRLQMEKSLQQIAAIDAARKEAGDAK